VKKEQFALKALEEYPDQVRFEYCPYSHSKLGSKIAEALEAAGGQGKFWELHGAFVANAPTSEVELYTMAESVGLDMGTFTEELTGGKYRETIESSIREAEAEGVTNLALFINGKEYRKYPGTFEELCQAIEKELDRLEVGND